MENEILMAQIDNYVFSIIGILGAGILAFMVRDVYIKHQFNRSLLNSNKQSKKSIKK